MPKKKEKKKKAWKRVKGKASPVTFPLAKRNHTASLDLATHHAASFAFPYSRCGAGSGEFCKPAMHGAHSVACEVLTYHFTSGQSPLFFKIRSFQIYQQKNLFPDLSQRDAATRILFRQQLRGLAHTAVLFMNEMR